MSYLAVMGIDPGHATGAAWCVAPATGTISSRMGSCPSPPRSDTLNGSYVEQAEGLCHILQGLRMTANNLRRKTGQEVRLIVAIEDFVLTRFESSERSGLDPIRITSSFVTALEMRKLNRGIELVYQSPSEAKAYVTNDRLRHWGLWIVGKDHERDAMRHMLLAITKSKPQQYGANLSEGTG